MKTPFLCALSALLLSATAPAWAQASASSVTVWGIIDACAVRSDLGNDTLNLLNSGCSYGSRLGFRGSEDLGGGQRAYFMLEQGINLDTGTLGQAGRAWGRKSLVGLAGRWGAVEMGRDNGTAFYIVQPLDPMHLGVGTASSTIWTGSPSTGAARVDNAISYLSPNWGGFSAKVQYAPGEQSAPAPSRSRDVLGMNAMYRSSETLIAMAYNQIANAADSANDRATTVGMRKYFKGFSIAAIAQFGAWGGSRTEAAPTSPSIIFSRDYRSYVFGGSVQVGAAGVINASFKQYDDRTSGNFDADQLSAEYVYSLSKRTDLYAAGSVLNNKGASSYSVSDASTAYIPVTPGARTSLLALGIKHTF